MKSRRVQRRIESPAATTPPVACPSCERNRAIFKHAVVLAIPSREISRSTSWPYRGCAIRWYTIRTGSSWKSSLPPREAGDKSLGSLNPFVRSLPGPPGRALSALLWLICRLHTDGPRCVIGSRHPAVRMFQEEPALCLGKGRSCLPLVRGAKGRPSGALGSFAIMRTRKPSTSRTPIAGLHSGEDEWGTGMRRATR